MWDHGGGSITGFGYDEINSKTSMTLDKINSALKLGGCKFDYVGFAACLMATYETAVMLNQYKLFLISCKSKFLVTKCIIICSINNIDIVFIRSFGT